MNKVILISIDGMRPDGLMQCGNPFVGEMMKRGSYTLEGRTVLPSITLPCHMSLFHSVPPERHNIKDNTYVPMVRPVVSLFEKIDNMGGVSAMYYGWEPLRNVSAPGCLRYAEYINAYTQDNTDGILTKSALQRIEKSKPDFVFLYMVETDEKGGHDHGWMSPEYLMCISNAIDNVKTVLDAVQDEYTVIVTADHGGHERMHGTELPEDMTIPMFFFGRDFEPGKRLSDVSILDITPTIAKLMDIRPEREWEGKPII